MSVHSTIFRYPFWKVFIDWFVAFILLLVFLIPLLILFILSSLNVRDNGIFTQIRIGRFGNKFNIYKFRTINGEGHISSFGNFIRKYKLDEIPQLVNILKGEMSFVGPRPDVPGYYDKLTGNEIVLLELRPGITSPASIKYSREEELLKTVADPEWYNDHIIFPDKVQINLRYQKDLSFKKDLSVIWYTIRSVFFN